MEMLRIAKVSFVGLCGGIRCEVCRGVGQQSGEERGIVPGAFWRVVRKMYSSLIWFRYAMAVRDFKKFFKRRDPNHLIGECPKPPRDKNQRAFVGGSWSDSGEENDENIQDETCLVSQAPNEVCSESSYFSDENSSIDDLALDNEYDKLCKMSLKIIAKNKRLKAIRNILENELRELKDELSILEKNKGVDLDCAKRL
ncbi:hypothetical protein Tco_1374051 [Tanacetum coccineum]